MHQRPVRRALTLALTGVLAFAGAAAADTVRADGDALTPGAQTLVDLGEVAPSAIVSVQVGFELTCSSTTHPDPGQTVALVWGAQSAPSGGAVLSATTATVGPIPVDWTTDGTGCASPSPVLLGATTSTVRLRAPSVPNVGYMYTVGWTRSLSPIGIDDGHALSGTFTAINFRLAVVVNAAPVLTVPADRTVEGDTTGGWIAAYPGVTATDAEDDPDPTPICSPAAGEVLPLGTTTVACSVSDSGGRGATDSFDVTVVDTTPPTLAVSDDLDVTTDDPAGATLAYDPPTTTDVVDGEPSVACLPADGSSIPVGTTAVTCTATDASGNRTSGAFDVTVRYVPSHVASVTWLEPIGAGTQTFIANRGRTVPVKAILAIDGDTRSEGDAGLTVTPCDGGAPRVLPLTYGGGHWSAALDTTVLVGSCHSVAATMDGLVAGSFRLDLRGVEPAKAKGGRSR